MLLFTLANSLPFYILARATQGAAMSMVFVAGYYLLIQSAPEDTLSYAFGNLDVFLAAGFIGGPLLGGFIYQFAGYHSVVVLIFFLLAMDLSSRSLIIVQPDGVDWPNSPEIDHHPEVEFPRAKAYDSIENSGRNGDITRKTLTMWQLMRDARVMIAAASMASYHLLITALENVSYKSQ